MPWGEVKGEVLGDPSAKKSVLCIHGWLDNLVSFYPLSKHLSDFRMVCIDLPGHGHSDPFPPGANYSMSDGLLVIKRVQDELDLFNAPLMGHSLGAGMCWWFAAAFPDRVSRLIALDLIGFGPVPVHKHVSKTRRSVEMADDLARKSASHKLPTYSLEDAVGRAFTANRLIHGEGSISRESVEKLLQRGLREVEPGKFTWRADLRLRMTSPVNLVLDQVEHVASKIDCPHLIVKALESPYYMSDEVAERVLHIYRNNNPDFVLAEVLGGHHVHMDDADRVAKIVGKFLRKDFKGKGSEEKENPRINF